MKFNQLISALFLIAIVLKTNAQEFKLGKVSVAELEEKSHPQDPSAAAAILFKKGDVRFEYSQDKGFEMVTVVKTRVKIYKKEGSDWANQAVQYYLASNVKESVFFSDAVTFNLIGGKIEKTKLKTEGEFDEKINKYWGRKKITMPNVKEGSVIEYEYTIRSPRASELKEWFFQTSIPVNYSEFITYVPEFYVYNPNPKGYIFPKVTVEKSQKSIIISSKERSGIYTTKTTFSQDKIDYQETKTTYLAKNLPAMKEESFVNNIENYTASVTHELAMTKFPNSIPEMYSTDWNSVVKTIYNYDDFGPELNKTGYFEQDLQGVIAGLNAPEDKITAILQFVKATVKWDEYYGYSCNDGVRQAYNKKSGNVAEINLMLTAMLRYAGLTANPVLVSTRSNGIALFPNRTAFNYVIAAVEDGQNLILLDATDAFSAPNILPIRDLNWVGRLIRKDGSSIEVDLMPQQTANDLISMNYSVDEKGEVLGKLRRQRTNHHAMLFRSSFKGTKEDAYLEKFENDNNNIEVSEYIRTNETDIKLPVVETLSFKGGNFSEKVGDAIYIKPLLSFTTSVNPFKQEIREYPVDFAFPLMDKYVVNIQVPDGFKIDSYPKTEVVSMQDGLATFKFLTSATDNSVQISFLYQINASIIGADYYPALKEFFQKMIDKQNEKIVLKKV
ncbi:hypothetical protein FVB9288_00287 [Flavobacterium sp. CECT 9288]|uniref:DUF3857 domain-containing protein n=1 Tax=Flavobacterium sp. CECT 9288 TaxID=2845819 RepID=UPI001E53D348|nr:DUF3857 domain-containing protein [Flavobacterium sp. CECT 9288]CAH0334689.1 hypothetical protein FVB9288_00287 [Flavobacterium sp. CECT 9288]